MSLQNRGFRLLSYPGLIRKGKAVAIGRTLLAKIFKVEPGITLGQWLYDRIANNWPGLVSLFGAGGGMTALAAITDWARAYGPAGVGAIGLLSALGAFLFLSLAQKWMATAAERRANASTIEDWRKDVSGFNPLDKVFTGMRIRIGDLAHPIDKTIKDKQFVNCQLIGPANLIVRNHSYLSGIHMNRCDFVAIQVKKPVDIWNFVVIDDTIITGGEIIGATFFVHPQMVSTFVAMGVQFITLTGDPAIDDAP